MGGFGWSYPPGVTGNELEIAGPSWEGTVERECEQQNVSMMAAPTDLVEALDDLLTKADGVFERLSVGRLVRLLKDAPLVQIDVEQCQFNGKADAWEYGGVLHWTCPLCGWEYEEEPDVEEPYWPEEE